MKHRIFKLSYVSNKNSRSKYTSLIYNYKAVAFYISNLTINGFRFALKQYIFETVRTNGKNTYEDKHIGSLEEYVQIAVSTQIGKKNSALGVNRVYTTYG